MDQTQRKRWIRLKFSLRFALLLLLTCLACLLAYHAWYSKVRRDALAAVVNVGAHVEFIDSSLPNWLLDLIGREYFVKIETVDGLYRKLSDDHLAAISKLPELRHIQTNHVFLGSLMGSVSISSNGNTGENQLVTDKGMESISHVRRLESLVLFNTTVTDQGIEQLTKLNKIKHLKISSLEITDASFPHLAKLQSLQQLWTSGTSITPQGIERLRLALPNCEVISATGDKSSFYDL